jgi:hypothetical protein
MVIYSEAEGLEPVSGQQRAFVPVPGLNGGLADRWDADVEHSSVPLADSDSARIILWSVYGLRQQAFPSLLAWAGPGAELLVGAAATVVVAGCVSVRVVGSAAGVAALAVAVSVD